MTAMVRRILLRVALPLLLVAGPGLTAEAQTTIVENADGSISVTTGGQEIVIPADLAAGVIGALRDNANDPQGLRAAIETLVAGHAGGADGAPLAAAIAAFAVYESSGDSAVVTAIVNGASAGNPAVSTPALVSALPAATAGAKRRAPPVVQPSSQSTAENPLQVSPAG